MSRLIPAHKIAARLAALSLFLLLVACGGGGGGGGGGSAGTGGAVSSSSSASSSASSSSSSSSSSASSTVANTVDVVIDAGPAALSNGSGNVPYVSVTVCAAGTTTCQTIDHVLVDTGSVGLRIEHDALNATMQTALAASYVKTGSDPVGECYQYLDGYVFGSVASADVTVGSEAASGLKMMVIGDRGNFATVPTACSSGGGDSLDTVDDFGANGVIGIGLSSMDCGTFCNTRTNSYYYDCASGGCTQVAWASASQIQNPITLFPVDNNGSALEFPAPNAAGQVSLHGTLTFGIATQSNNALGAATVLPVNGSGYITAVYNSKSLTKSFIDSGTNFLSFSDTAIAQCTGQLKGFYCPPTPLTISVSLSGTSGASATASLPVISASTFPDADAVLPGLAGDPSQFSNVTTISSSFDFGLPFFYGRKVFTSISGRAAGSVSGGFFAF